MITVGLTGGIACGKSTVARLLRERGVPVVDADQASRAVVEPGRPALAEIAEAFGEGVLAADGSLDRAALRALVIGDSEEKTARRRQLEAITHPRIFAEVAERLQTHAAAGAEIAAVEAALMVETGSYRHYAALLVVACSPEVQLGRLVAREGISLDEARRWVNSQLPLVEKIKVADFVIRNDGDMDALRQATAVVWEAVCRRVGLETTGPDER